MLEEILCCIFLTQEEMNCSLELNIKLNVNESRSYTKNTMPNRSIVSQNVSTICKNVLYYYIESGVDETSVGRMCIR